MEERLSLAERAAQAAEKKADDDAVRRAVNEKMWQEGWEKRVRAFCQEEFGELPSSMDYQLETFTVGGIDFVRRYGDFYVVRGICEECGEMILSSHKVTGLLSLAEALDDPLEHDCPKGGDGELPIDYQEESEPEEGEPSAKSCPAPAQWRGAEWEALENTEPEADPLAELEANLCAMPERIRIAAEHLAFLEHQLGRSKLKAINAQRALDAAVADASANAYRVNLIDGKNAEARAVQLAVVLDNDGPVQEARRNLAQTQGDIGLLEYQVGEGKARLGCERDTFAVYLQLMELRIAEMRREE